jgi:hypothetical protein
MLGGVVAEHLDRPLYASASVIDLDLEAIKAHLDRHELEVAESKLKELESRAHDKLQPHHWYQLKALLSRVHTDHWEWEKAGRELLDAKRFMPNAERARINEALGLELLGEREKAHALATALRIEYALSVRLLSIWVRTAPDDLQFDAIAGAAVHLAKDDEELNLALALRALATERFRLRNGSYKRRHQTRSDIYVVTSIRSKPASISSNRQRRGLSFGISEISLS